MFKQKPLLIDIVMAGFPIMRNNIYGQYLHHHNYINKSGIFTVLHMHGRCVLLKKGGRAYFGRITYVVNTFSM